jgi:DNA modification methylase
MRQVIPTPLSALRPYARNARTHSKRQIKELAKLIQRYGFTNPILAADDGTIIAGHGRYEAAKHLNLEVVPVIRLSDLTEAERKAYTLADNRSAEKSTWDRELLSLELKDLEASGFEDLDLTGFSLGEIQTIFDEAAEREEPTTGPDDEVPDLAERVVTRPGDLWALGPHRLVCGDSRLSETYAVLMQGEPADLVCSDPPFNVKIEGNVSGLGRTRHSEFAFASGEMTQAEFTDFLTAFLRCSVAHTRDGAILFVYMDWRHMGELLAAGTAAGLDLKNLCVWAKTNAGMGSFYRSQHELCFVFKWGTSAHLNTFELGQHGRHRSNLWTYAGVNTFKAGRMDELASHPTVKPVAMLADAIKDVTRHRGIVLDPFLGSGSTLIAAEKTGRRARGIEYEPAYCDLTIRRWQTYTGKPARLIATSQTFEEVEDARLPPGAEPIKRRKRRAA